MSDLPGVEFIIFDKQSGLKSYLKLRRQIKSRQFDILLHMQVALRASLISLAVSAPIKLGFDRQRAHDYQWLFTNQQIEPHPQQHVLDGFFGFLEKLGLQERCLEWNIPIPGVARDKIRKIILPGKPVLVINACSSSRFRNWRNWPADRYAAVIDHATEKLGMQVVLTGGPAKEEQEFADEIIRLSKKSPINLVGQTTLKELLALLQRAAVVIAPDTGPAHMATAIGTPVIGLYATSNPMRTGPYRDRHMVIDCYQQALRQFSGRSLHEVRWGERVRHPNAMQLIQVNDVILKLEEIIC